MHILTHRHCGKPPTTCLTFAVEKAALRGCEIKEQVAQLRQLERLHTKPKGCIAKGGKEENSSNASQDGFIQKKESESSLGAEAPALRGARSSERQEAPLRAAVLALNYRW